MKRAIKAVGLASFIILAGTITSRAANGEVCVTCHSSDMGGVTQELKHHYAEWESSIHARVRVGCYDCHGGNPDGKDKDEIHSGRKDLNNPQNAVNTCGKCHKGQQKAFKQSMHYKAILDKKAAPSCVTCHGSRKASKINPIEVPGTCANCHNSQTGNHPDIPAQAAQVFELEQRIEAGIDNSMYSILKASQEGKDVSQKRRDLAAVTRIVEELSVSWHKFDLRKVEDTLRPLQVSLKMASFEPTFNDLIYRWLKIIALLLVILVCLWWMVDKFRGTNDHA